MLYCIGVTVSAIASSFPFQLCICIGVLTVLVLIVKLLMMIMMKSHEVEVLGHFLSFFTKFVWTFLISFSFSSTKVCIRYVTMYTIW